MMIPSYINKTSKKLFFFKDPKNVIVAAAAAVQLRGKIKTVFKRPTI